MTDTPSDSAAAPVADEAVAWRYRHPLNPNLCVVVAGPDWPERDPDMEPLYPAALVERLSGELAEARAGEKFWREHADKVVQESKKGFAALEEIDAAWEAVGIPNNRAILTLAEQVASLDREIETAVAARESSEAEAAALRREVTEARAAISFTDLPDKTISLSAAIYDLATGEQRVRAEAAALKGTVEFIARQAWRTDPPNASGQLTDAERFSAIKYHPTIQTFAKPHIKLAEAEALNTGEPG